MPKLFAWIQKYERHLSAFAMVAGFIADNLIFGRVDLLQTHIVFASYTAVCFTVIPLLHWIETRHPSGFAARSRVLLSVAIQFALGGFWSGLVIFYGRSADIGASWPFLLFLVLILLGGEYFHQYHDRLVFTSILFFFALYSYAIFAVPIYTHDIGTIPFLESGAVAIGAFAAFTALLRVVARERFHRDVRRIRAGALGVLILLNVFYFTNVLPPLPLSAEAAGIYHSVWRVPGAYLGTTEAESWWAHFLGLAPTLHIAPGELVSAYSSVFAPTTLAATIQHRWEWFDPLKKEWIVKSIVAYPILGGRDGGYRGYSALPITEEGEWRTSVETSDGRRIARLPFTIKWTTYPSVQTTVTLK